MLSVIAQGQLAEWLTSKDFSWWHTIVDNLRKILVQNSIELYNQNAKVINYEHISICTTRTIKSQLKCRRRIPPTSPFSDLKPVFGISNKGDERFNSKAN